jgi:hypothetical protein
MDADVVKIIDEDGTAARLQSSSAVGAPGCPWMATTRWCSAPYLSLFSSHLPLPQHRRWWWIWGKLQSGNGTREKATRWLGRGGH